MSEPETNTDHPTEPRKLATTELWDQLRNTTTMVVSQDRSVWSIFGIFWAANAVLLVALFRTGEMPTGLVGKSVSGVGMLLSLAWLSIQQRALAYLHRYEDLAERIERELSFDPRFALSGKINTEDWERHLATGPRARTIMRICSLGVFLAWAAVLAILTIVEVL